LYQVSESEEVANNCSWDALGILMNGEQEAIVDILHVLSHVLSRIVSKYAGGEYSLLAHIEGNLSVFLETMEQTLDMAGQVRLIYLFMVQDNWLLMYINALLPFNTYVTLLSAMWLTKDFIMIIMPSFSFIYHFEYISIT